MNEEGEWRVIPGFGSYEINVYGALRRRTSKGLSSVSGTIKGSVSSKGYTIIALIDDMGKKKYLRVNRVMCIAFYGPPPSPKHEAAHWDDNKSNNHISNLRWATRKENIADAARNGRLAPQQGHRNANARLTEQKVLEIRVRYGTGETMPALATAFGVSSAAIFSAARGLSWAHIPGALPLKRGRKQPAMFSAAPEPGE